MSAKGRIVYLCPDCLSVSDRPGHCHRRRMAWDAGLPGDTRSRPCATAKGAEICPAPRWWMEAYWHYRLGRELPALAR